MPVLGITGGIATGKTFFTECLSRLVPSLKVFDADRCARELTTSDSAIIRAIRGEFGPEVFDGSGVLQRSTLRAMIFSDPNKRKALEAILHPAIRAAWLEMAGALREQPGSPWLAVDIPLLFETSAQSHFDKIVVVACSGATQRKRLMDTRRYTPGLAEGMIAAQLPLAEKIARADFAVWSDGVPESIEIQARLLSLHILY